MKLQTYGLDVSKFPKVTQLEIELLMVANHDPSRFSGLSRGQHIKHCIGMLWPDVMTRWNDWNELALWAWTNHNEIGVTGCAAAGKTFTFTLLSLVEYLAKPMGTRVALTSTTVPSLRGRIWAEMMKFARPVVPLFGLNVVDSQTKIQFEKGDDRSAIIALAVDSGAIEQAVGKLQGVHLPRMIICVDEAAASNPAIFSARANLAVGTDFYHFVALANASSHFDPHGLFCEPKMGWNSLRDDDEFWETKTGVCIRFDGLRSPNVKAGKTLYPYLFGQENIDTIEKNFGRGSMEWAMYCRGTWSSAGARNTIVDSSLIEAGRARESIVWQGGGLETIAALDPAFTSDGDDAILRFAKVGRDVNGNLIMLLTETIRLNLMEDQSIPLFYQVADQTIEELNKRGVKPENFALDSTGAGAGIADIISQRWKVGFHRVSFGGSATEDPISVEDNRQGKAVYANRVSQLWGQIKTLIMSESIRGLDDQTARELCGRIYSLKNEKTLLESKRDLKKRTKGNSPDRADALALLCQVFISQNGMLGANNKDGENGGDWDLLCEQSQLYSNYDS
jgi:hypothetical protein